MPKEFTAHRVIVVKGFFPLKLKLLDLLSDFSLIILHHFFILQGGNVKVTGGILCPSCALMKIPHVGCLAYVNVDTINSSSS